MIDMARRACAQELAGPDWRGPEQAVNTPTRLFWFCDKHCCQIWLHERHQAARFGCGADVAD